MTNKKPRQPEEDPRKLFRRLLEEAEKAGKESTVPLETNPDEIDFASLDSQQADATSQVNPAQAQQAPGIGVDRIPFPEKPTEGMIPSLDKDEVPTTPHGASPARSWDIPEPG
jgi:hypothetical protein